ncbi:MAG: low molecular weight phosphatase family protein [Bacteroidota bacterium]
MDTPPSSQVLFLCTGNYYRSRTAEELFNFYLPEKGLAWTAFSLGLKAEFYLDIHMDGLSPYAKAYLDAEKVPIQAPKRLPKDIQEPDFHTYDLIICMDEDEHRPMMQEKFPQYENQVTYWRFPDLHLASSQTVLPLLHEKVLELMENLKEK